MDDAKQASFLKICSPPIPCGIRLFRPRSDGVPAAFRLRAERATYLDRGSCGDKIGRVPLFFTKLFAGHPNAQNIDRSATLIVAFR